MGKVASGFHWSHGRWPNCTAICNCGRRLSLEVDRSKVCEHPTSEVVVQSLEKLACREGYPKEVASDCGSAFTSERFALYLRSVGVTHVLISPYHPQSSGLVERAKKSVKAALQTADLQKAERAE